MNIPFETNFQHMETTSQVNAEILAIISTINANYSELAKFLKEMPTNNASNEITLDQLEEYKDSLNELLSNYISHNGDSN